MAHIRRFEIVLADAAGFAGLNDFVVAISVAIAIEGSAPARQIKMSAGCNAQQRHRDKTDRQADKAGKVFCPVAEVPEVAQDADDGRQQHGTNPHRIEVIQVRAFELHIRGADAERLVDHQIRRQAAQPADRYQRENSQHALERAINSQLHQDQRNAHIEHQPYHPSRMAAGKPREKVRPSDGARVSVGHIDLHLRDHHHHPGEDQRHGGRLGEIVEHHLVHIHRVRCLQCRCTAGDGQIGEEGAEQHFDQAYQDPARAGEGQPEPPARAILAGLLRHKPQVIHLLADLRHHGKKHRTGGAKQHPVELGSLRVVLRGVLGPVRHPRYFKPGGNTQGQALQKQPQGLGADLEFAHRANAVGDDGDHRHRTQDVADGRWYPKQGVQCGGEYGGFDGEEDEGEAGVDQ